MALEIPPFRIQSIDFSTVTVAPEPPYVREARIEDLDHLEFHGDLEVYVAASLECLSERILLKGQATRRNLIRHVRECYRRIYRQASQLGVRGELISLREIIAEKVYYEYIEDDCVEVSVHLFEGAGRN